MKVSTLMAFATFLVVGINYSASVSLDDERLWIRQCRKEIIDEPYDRRHSCYWACYLRKWGMMKDGKLVDREKASDIMVDVSRLHRIQLKDGETIRQLAKQCYDEAKLKTEVCEIGGALMDCWRQGVRSAVSIE